MDETTLYANLTDADLTTIRDSERTKLGILATQASKFSSGYVPVEHTTQISDVLATLTIINTELTKRGIASRDPDPDSSITQIVQHYTEQRITARNNSTVSDVQQERSDPTTNQIVEADNSVIRGVTQRSGTTPKGA